MSRLDEQHMAAYLERDSMRSRDVVNEMASQGFHEFTDTPCGRLLARVEKDLGRPLGYGEMSDCLLDNFMEIADSREAHDIRNSVLVVFGRTTLGVYEGKRFGVEVQA